MGTGRLVVNSDNLIIFCPRTLERVLPLSQSRGLDYPLSWINITHHSQLMIETSPLPKKEEEFLLLLGRGSPKGG
jgi:hypothetical protein